MNKGCSMRGGGWLRGQQLIGLKFKMNIYIIK